MWGAENGGLPLTLTVALTTGQHYRAACDILIDAVLILGDDDLTMMVARGRYARKPPYSAFT